jgi:ribosome-binding factor A
MAYRLLRLNELIKEELGEILLREMEFPEGCLVTITRVETAENLSVARVLVSVFPERFFPPVLKQLMSRVYFLQQKLNRRLLIRPVPRLLFVEEKEVVSASRVEKLIEQAREKPSSKSR